MNSSTKEVQDWLRRKAQDLFGSTPHPSQIAVKRRGTILDASMVIDGVSRRIIVKRFPAGSFDVVDFIRSHGRLIAANPALAAITPRFLATHGEHQWIAMQHIPGETLEARMLRALGGGPAA